MSSERINHAADSNTILSNIQPDEMGGHGIADWLALAQVHATLALVEQERIANIVALVALPAVHAESLDRYPGVKDQILEALGLS